jgi:Domain of unknown function (DUF4133)
MSSSYPINKGINKPVEFKGLKAQYIWYLGGGLLTLLVLFAIMYIIGVNTFICLGVTFAGGTGWFMYVYRLSRTYGEHGMSKRRAKKMVPTVLRSHCRTVFFKQNR